MSQKPYYVVLTGHKVNAGDFLIRHKTLDLLSRLRPDRDIINFPAWEEFDDKRLRIVNQSQALIMAGGPALQYDCYPRVYPLRKNLNEIKVPISLMGVGTKPYEKNLDFNNYKFSGQTKDFLNFVKASGIRSSVRDFHSLHTLKNYNFENCDMIGCPVLYDFDHLNQPIVESHLQNPKVVFSMGVSFVKSRSMNTLMKTMILNLKQRFANNNFSVSFHHSLQSNPYQSAQFTGQNAEMANWLQSLSIPYVEISGDLDAMLNLYRDTDLHVGFRLHAHLLMCSWSKPSILFAEDGRALGFKNVLGGDILKAYYKVRMSKVSKLLRKLNPNFDLFKAKEFTEFRFDDLLKPDHLLQNIKHVRNSIAQNFSIRQSYIKQLP